MIVDDIKLKDNSPGGFAFNEPDLTKSIEFNFAHDWIVNPNNSEGISIVDNVIRISKVKPNTWFIKSKYGFTTASQRNEKFYNKNWIINGISKANSDGLISGVTVHSLGAVAWGLVITPINSSNALMISTNDGCNQMGIYGGGFKSGPVGALNFGYTVDGQRALYDRNVNGYDSYGEVALCFFSSVGTDEDGYINFSTPITITCIMASQFVDPTSKEAFTISLGSNKLYDKEKNFENLLMNHQLAFKDEGFINDAVQPVSGNNKTEINDMRGYNYVITTNRCTSYAGGKYKNSGQPISIPIPTNFIDMLDKHEPIKFFKCFQTDKNKKTGLWYNTIKWYKENNVTDAFGCENLFAGSNINGTDYTDGDGWIDININCSDTVIDGCFDYAGLTTREYGPENVRFIVNGGSITKARTVFRQNKYRLKNVEFINNVNPNEHVCPNMLSGMFEFCGLPEFPKGLGFSNEEKFSNLSEGTCGIGYVAHASAFKTFGNLKPDGSRYEVLVDPSCMEAFNTSISPNDGPNNNLTEILCDLNMKFVNPSNSSERVFLCENLQKANIKNLNKGVWSLDGINHGGLINGNIPNLDEDSVNYLLSNVYDLRTNNGGDSSKSEYTAGLFHSEIYLPESLKEKASQKALSIAFERGWDVYFGGELAELGGGVGLTANTLDIVFVNKETEKLIIVKNEEWNINDYPADKWEPIGIVVIPGSHGVLKDGTGTKNQCGVMSITAMACYSPEYSPYGGEVCYFGGYGIDINGKSDGLGRYDSVTNGLLNYNTFAIGDNGSNTTNRLYMFGYLPVQRSVGGNATWQDLINSSPSPYAGSDMKSGGYNQDYGTTKFDTSSNFNALADFKGIVNTKILTDMANAQTDWRTADTIINEFGPGYYPAACCCARFHTTGTKAFVDCTTEELRNGTGFWYLPAMGELGYISPRFYDIRDIISKLMTSYNVGVQLSVFASLQSSSEYDEESANVLNLRGGDAGSTGKNYDYSDLLHVRAFMRL